MATPVEATTWKLCCTDGAAEYVALPAWSPWIVHVPSVTNVTDVPLTVHTGVVNDENDTAKPEDAEADTETGEAVMGWLLSAPNVMV